MNELTISWLIFLSPSSLISWLVPNWMAGSCKKCTDHCWPVTAEIACLLLMLINFSSFRPWSFCIYRSSDKRAYLGGPLCLSNPSTDAQINLQYIILLWLLPKHTKQRREKQCSTFDPYPWTLHDANSLQVSVDQPRCVHSIISHAGLTDFLIMNTVSASQWTLWGCTTSVHCYAAPLLTTRLDVDTELRKQ